MIAAVPDPRECQTCGYDEANHKREAHLYRPAAVSDPRFRDQLAEALLLGSGGRQYWDPEELRDIVDDLMPTIAAEVEARVQAAANQRAAEELLKLGDDLADTFYAGKPLINGYAHRRIRARAAALASPAPGNRALDAS